MEQKIFTLGLSVSAISLYLIMADYLSLDAAITREGCLERWQEDEAALDAALEELAAHKVVRKGGDPIEVRDAAEWVEAAR